MTRPLTLDSLHFTDLFCDLHTMKAIFITLLAMVACAMAAPLPNKVRMLILEIAIQTDTLLTIKRSGESTDLDDDFVNSSYSNSHYSSQSIDQVSVSETYR